MQRRLLFSVARQQRRALTSGLSSTGLPLVVAAARAASSSAAATSVRSASATGFSAAWAVALAAGAGLIVASAASASCADDTASAVAASPCQRSRLAACHTALSALLGPRFSVEDSDLAAHAADANSYHKAHNAAEAPSGVAFCESTEEVAAAVGICAKYGVTMIPYGSGTSLEGHTSAPHAGICIDLSRMQAIRAIHLEDMDCVVEAGLSWGNLNLALKEHNLFFPVDPGPGASIGGMTATSCSGTNAVRYGTMKHNVLSLTVVLPDGSIVKTANRARKSSAGYDLTRLFIGSEGTLGIVTEATLRLQPLPASTAVATVSFDSIGEAASATAQIVREGVRVGAVELLDDGCIEAVNAYAGLSYPKRPATLFFKFHGAPAAVAEEIELARTISRAHGSGEFVFAVDALEREKLWEARKGALWACMAFRPQCEAWTTDVCVPISRMAEAIEAAKKDLAELDLDAEGRVVNLTSGTRRVTFPSAVVGHVGDGNFHAIFMIDPASKEELTLASEVNRRMVQRAIAMQGTCTGEHGVGVGKKEFMELEHGPRAVDLMRQIKTALDPQNIMNPGKIFDQRPVVATAKNTSCCKMQPATQLTKDNPPCC